MICIAALINEFKCFIKSFLQCCYIKMLRYFTTFIILWNITYFPFVYCGLTHSFLMTRKKPKGTRIIPFLQIGKWNINKMTQGHTTAKRREEEITQIQLLTIQNFPCWALKLSLVLSKTSSINQCMWPPPPSPLLSTYQVILILKTPLRFCLVSNTSLFSPG